MTDDRVHGTPAQPGFVGENITHPCVPGPPSVCSGVTYTHMDPDDPWGRLMHLVHC